eukprot:1233846-Pleurochrysis_carterae.AAC.1
MTGLPISWREMWGKLRGRFAREHLESGNTSADGDVSTGAESLQRPVTNVAPEANVPLPLVSSVTGINHAPGARKAAKRQ